jgi:hypothetical protein
MLRRGTIVLAWAGLGLWGIQGCGGFLDPIAARGTGGAAAGQTSGGSGGNGGSGGSVGFGGIADGSVTGGAGGCPTECVLVPNEYGWVPPQDSVCCTIQGAWYPYNDCNDSPSNCTQQQQPALDAGVFRPDNNLNRMCTSGTTAPVGEAGSSKVWGAGIGLWLNQVTDLEIHRPIVQLARMPIGFRFTLSGTLGSNGLRVNFPYTDSDPVPHFVTEPEPGVSLDVRIANARQGIWVTDASTIDPARVVAIQFAIPAGSDAIAFDFCVSTLTALFPP